jgi:restriction system protein
MSGRDRKVVSAEIKRGGIVKGNVELTPEEFEKEVESLLRKEGQDLKEFKVVRTDVLPAGDGTYEIDITARFKALGTEFLVLVECKRYSSAVKREVVQVLHDKLRATGAQKGMLFATSGFQRGAIVYARNHRIALVWLVDGRATYYSPHVPERLRLPCIALVANIDNADSETKGVVRYRTIGFGDNDSALLDALGITASLEGAG